MAKLTPFPESQLFDSNGDPLNGGKVYTYEAGTTTNKTTYTDASEDTANANPVILDSEGRGEIWLGEGSYKIRVFDSADNLIDERDNVIGDTSSSFLGSVFSVATNTTVTSAYQNSLISATAALTLSLLAAADAGEGFSFAVKNDGSGSVIIDPDAAETVNGAATFTLGPNDSIILVCNGSNWLLQGGLSGQNITYSGNNTYTGDVVFSGKVSFADDGELTISSGAITVTGSNHSIDTESDAASDDLDTITGGVDGMELTLRIENDAREVVFKDGTGNIETPDGNDITLSDDENAINLIYDAALEKWLVVSTFRAEPGASTTTTAGVVEKATQAECEAETTDKNITADNAKYLPGVAKAWAMVTVSGGTPTLRSSKNITSITDTATGRLTITIATDFSNAYWAALCTIDAAGLGSYSYIHTASSIAAGSVLLTNNSTAGTATDPDSWSFVGLGDQ